MLRSRERYKNQNENKYVTKLGITKYNNYDYRLKEIFNELAPRPIQSISCHVCDRTKMLYHRITFFFTDSALQAGSVITELPCL